MNLSATADAPGFAELLERGAAWVVLGTLAWAALLLGAAVVERASRGRLAALERVRCPGALRPLLLGVAGLALALPGTAAHAVSAPLPAPSRPADGPAPAVAAAPRAPSAPDHGRATVRPGDSLWSLARRHLGPRADDGQVAVVVARTHRLNLDVVGPDPDLLHPGQQLRWPGSHPTPTPSEAP